jgi:7-cyano-7-deazaguanine synthase in queuosine biosynthesis
MIADRIRIERFDVAPQVLDFLRISLAVVAADRAVLRAKSQNGWTREIELEIPVEDRQACTENQRALEKMLRFLTGDVWTLAFTSAKFQLGQRTRDPEYLEGDIVALLSGGADSLVGALDLSTQGKHWTAVSQTSSEKTIQREFAARARANRHLAWTHGVHTPSTAEGSQRARSIGFFAFGLVAAAATEAYRDGTIVALHASENGLISLNPALTPARIGSASTRTTHPSFVAQLQDILRQLNVNVELRNEYQKKTKGEMLSQCTQPQQLREFVSRSMSCGKSGRIKMHCGRCVPCIIRRAAFRRSGIDDLTPYQYGPQVKVTGFRNSDDVRCAYLGSANYGDRAWVESAVLPSLFEAQIEDRVSLVDVAQRGLEEVYEYLAEALQ